MTTPDQPQSQPPYGPPDGPDPTVRPPYPSGSPQPPSYPPPSAYPLPSSYPPPPGGAYPGGYAGSPSPGGFPGYPTGTATYPGYASGSIDPIVPPPAGGFGAWWSHLTATYRRNWRMVIPIVLLTYSLPTVLCSLIGGAFQNRSVTTDSNGDAFSFHWAASAGFVVTSIVFWFAIAFLAAIGFAAITRVVTRQAAGVPVSIGDALRYGVSRMVPLGPLFLLAALMVGVGLAFCVLPGLYLALATSMIGPVVLFERASMGRSFSLVNRHFGAVLGRFAALVALLVVLGFVVACIGALLTGGGRAGVIGTGIVSAVLEAPLFALLHLGVIMTYTQLRASEAPTDAATLNAALDGQPVGVTNPTW